MQRRPTAHFDGTAKSSRSTIEVLHRETKIGQLIFCHT